MKILKKVKAFLKGLLGSGFEFLRRNSEAAVLVTENIKKWVESPMADIVVELIPGKLDNTTLVFLRKWLPKVTAQMAIAHSIIENSDDPDQVVQQTVLYLKGLNKDARIGFYIEIAGRLTYAMSKESEGGEKITLPEAVAISQLAYQELFKKHIVT